LARGPSLRRRLLRWLVLFGVVYAVLVLVLMFFERSLIFHPTTERQRWTAPADVGSVEDVWLTLPDGIRVHAWHCSRTDASWHVLYCHGNAGNLSDRQPLIRALQQFCNASVFIFDYPGYGKSNGRPTEASCYAAGRTAYRWLREEKRIPPTRLILYGESLGAAVATELAANSPHAALVLVSPFTSIPDMAQAVFPFLPARWLVRTRFDNQARIKGYYGPMLIVHGTADEVVPFEQGRILFNSCPSSAKQFLPIAGGDHNSLPLAAVFQGVHQFLAGLPTPD